jgi:nicotinamide-nucleotide amidase
MFSSDLLEEATALLALLRAKGLKVATAESCTGGLIAGLLTEIPGSSDVVDRGFVTYSNEAKAQMLGIDPELIGKYGAVSEQVARAMATGALAHSDAGITVAVTGVAGPGGGSAEKPVGLVHFGACRRGGGVIHYEARYGDVSRTAIRIASVRQALAMIKSLA